MTEIHLILAGVELGPYSEEQVRRYLAEGLAQPSDLARLAGVEEWSELEWLLDNLPPAPVAVREPIEDWDMAFDPAPLSYVEPVRDEEEDVAEPIVEPEPIVKIEPAPEPIPEPELIPAPKAELPPPTPTSPPVARNTTLSGVLKTIRTTKPVTKAPKRIVTLQVKKPAPLPQPQLNLDPAPPPAPIEKPVVADEPVAEVAQPEPVHEEVPVTAVVADPPVEIPPEVITETAPPLVEVFDAEMPEPVVAPEITAEIAVAPEKPVEPEREKSVELPQAALEEPPSVESPAAKIPPPKTSPPLPRSTSATQTLQPKGPTPPEAPEPGSRAIKLIGRTPLSIGTAPRRKQPDEPRKGATAALEALRAASPVPPLKADVRSTRTAPPRMLAPEVTPLPPVETPPPEVVKKEPEVIPTTPEPAPVTAKSNEPVVEPAAREEEKPHLEEPTATPPLRSRARGKFLDIPKKKLSLETSPLPAAATPPPVESKAPEPLEAIVPAPEIPVVPQATPPPLPPAQNKSSEPEVAPTVEPTSSTPPETEIKTAAPAVEHAPEETKTEAQPKSKRKTQRLEVDPLTDEIIPPASEEASTSVVSSEPTSDEKPPTSPQVPKRLPTKEELDKLTANLRPFNYVEGGRQPAQKSPQVKPSVYYLAFGLVFAFLFFSVTAYYLIAAGWRALTAHAPAPVVALTTPAETTPTPETSPEFNPRTSNDFYKRGLSRQTKGDLDGALADFNQALVIDPLNANAYTYRAFVEQAKGGDSNVDAAVADYDHALKLNPANAVAYFNRGVLKSQRADLDGAISDFDQALILSPKLAVAYYNRGMAKNQKNDLDDAITDFSQAIDFDPKLVGAYYNRGLAYQAKGDLDPALADYNQALSLDPNIAVAYYYRGLIKEQQFDLDGAIVDYDQALVLDPKNDEVYYNRGLAKQAKGDLDGSLKDLEQFCDRSPLSIYADWARLYIWLVNSLQDEGKFANQELSNALRKQWNATGSDFVTKTAAFLTGSMTETEYLAAATSPDPKTNQGQHCEAWYYAAMKRLMAKDRDTAIDYLNKCLATEERDYCQYISAKAELKRLQALK